MYRRELEKSEKKAAVLVDALPYMVDFHDRTMVISYTCSDILTTDQEHEMMVDLTILHSLGIHIVLVHDTRMGSDKFRENKRLAKVLELSGVKAIGVCGIDEQTLHMTLDNGYIPVITPNDIDTEHVDLNPMDTALSIAQILHAEKLLYVGRFDGVTDEEGNIRYSLALSELIDYVKNNSFDDRLKHMYDNAVVAIESGIHRVHILNGRIPHALLVELFSVEGVGSAIMKDNSELYNHEKLHYARTSNYSEPC